MISWRQLGIFNAKSVFPPMCLQDTAIVHPVPIRMTPSKIHMQEMELKRTGSGEEAVAGLGFRSVANSNAVIL